MKALCERSFYIIIIMHAYYNAHYITIIVLRYALANDCYPADSRRGLAC